MWLVTYIIFLLIIFCNFLLDYDKLFFSLFLKIGLLMKNKWIDLFSKIDKRKNICEDENITIWLLVYNK